MYKQTGWRGEHKAADVDDVVQSQLNDDARGYDGALEDLRARVDSLAKMLAATLDVMTQDQRDRFASAFGWDRTP